MKRKFFLFLMLFVAFGIQAQVRTLTQGSSSALTSSLVTNVNSGVHSFNIPQRLNAMPAPEANKRMVCSVADLTKVKTSAAIKRAPAQVTNFSVLVAIENLTATDATIITTPSDSNTVYLWDVFSAEQYQEIQNGGLVDYGIYDLLDYGTFLCQNYGNAYIVTGVDSYIYNKLTPETVYYVVVYAVDLANEVCSSIITTYTFTTPEPEPTVAFSGSISVTDIATTSATATITSNTDSYYYYDWIPAYQYDSIQDGFYGYSTMGEFVTAFLNYYVSYYTQQGYSVSYANFLNLGDAQENISVIPSTDYVFYAISVNPFTGECVGNPTTYRFTTGEIPSSLYLLGNIQDWDPANGIPMTSVAPGVFTYEYPMYGAFGELEYFTFTSVQSNDWTVINANRYGPSADGFLVEGGSTYSLAKQGDVAFCIAPGNYTFTVDLNNMVFSCESVQAPQPKIYTCKEAIAAYQNGLLANGDAMTIGAYISNIFFKPSNFSRYGSVSIWLTDTLGGTAHEFELFNCYSYNGNMFVDYTNKDVIDNSSTSYIDVDYVIDGNGNKFEIGNYVTAAGEFNFYSTSSVYELNTGCYLLSGASSTTDPTLAEYYLVGDFNGWEASPNYQMTKVGVEYKLEIWLEPGEYQFKINVGNWSQNWGGTFDANMIALPVFDGPNCIFRVNEASTVKFYFNPDNYIQVVGDGISKPSLDDDEYVIFEGYTNLIDWDYWEIPFYQWDEVVEGTRLQITVDEYSYDYGSVLVQLVDYGWNYQKTLFDSDSVNPGLHHVLEVVMDEDLLMAARQYNNMVLTGCNYVINKVSLIKDSTYVPPTYDYYVVGSMNEWQADSTYKMTESNDEYTINLPLEAGIYEFKINVGEWTKNWGGRLDAYLYTWAQRNGENCEINVEYSTVVTIHFRPDEYIWVEGQGVTIVDHTLRYTIDMHNPTVANLSFNKRYIGAEITIHAHANEWTWFTLPVGIDMSNIQAPANANWVIRSYNGYNRATGNGSTWENVDKNDGWINPYSGYILHCQPKTGNDTIFDFVLRSPWESEIWEEMGIGLNEYDYSYTEEVDKSWNLIGNPYPDSLYWSYTEGATSPIIVWNGRGYDAYTRDDNYWVKPSQAFFMQRPDRYEDYIIFRKDMLSSYMEGVQAPARSAEASDRQVLNFTLCGNQYTDRARLVINEAAQMSYERGCDAAKFMSDGVAQLYMLENGTRMAINERPMDAGMATMGISVAQDGIYTLALDGNSHSNVMLTDNQTGTTMNLAMMPYTFSAKAGENSGRFTITLGAQPVATGIQNMTTECAARIYTIDGKYVGNDVRNLNAGSYFIHRGDNVQKFIKK